MTHQKKTHWLYFAFGSNMNPVQIRSRCHAPETIGIAKLPFHKVSFFGHSRVWDGALETVEPAIDQDVWGVIYRLTRSDWDRLDAWQDVRLDGTGAYFHFPTTVVDAAGKEYSVILYKKDMLGIPELPSTEYLQSIIEGAVTSGLPPVTLERWRNTQSRRASYAVPRRGNFDPALLAEMTCAGCDG